MVKDAPQKKDYTGLQIAIVFAYIVAIVTSSTWAFFKFSDENSRTILASMLFSCIGGSLYCLRSVYLNRCVFDRWSVDWLPWYFIRPPVSLTCGLVCYIFVKAGVLAFEAEQVDTANNFALYSLAFISGYNVDNFLKKIEEVSKSIFGISQTNVGQLPSVKSNPGKEVE